MDTIFRQNQAVLPNPRMEPVSESLDSIRIYIYIGIRYL